MTDPAELDRECEVFCRYLCDEPPSDYVRAKYRAAHEVGAIEPPGGATSFDRALVTMAASTPGFTRAIDGYARVFTASGLLRRKLVALLAILETRSPSDAVVDTPTSTSVAGFVAGLAWLGVTFAVTTLVVAIALLPVRIVCALQPRS
jgi:hypothetical protein